MPNLAVACVQSTATTVPQDNLAAVIPLIRGAAAGGAQLICLPEAFDYLNPSFAALSEYARSEAEHPALLLLSRLALELSVWLLAGSVSVKLDDGRMANRSALIGPDGMIRARYDKIHLFDVDLPDGSHFRESDFYRPGDRAVVAAGPGGIQIGMAICYDVRFPHLHRALAQAGAQIITMPAAFSSMTGPLHWEVLLRARAIETGCFVLAPAQCGDNYPGRRSYGQSLIIDPWGRVLGRLGDAPGVLSARLDLNEVAAFRSAIPSPITNNPFRIGA